MSQLVVEKILERNVYCKLWISTQWSSLVKSILMGCWSSWGRDEKG